MITKIVVSAFALASVLSFTGPAFAQDHMIDGKPVPADQVEAVQAKCDELRAAVSGDAAAGAEAPAADASAPAADAPATTDATTSTDTAADPAATPSPDTATTDASTETVIDLETLTIAMCDEGGFTASTP